MIRIHFQVKGRVQGVGFRYFVLSTAQKCGLTGWVRNEMDGSVAGETQGEEEKINDFIRMLSSGNGLSRVENVYQSEINLQYEEKKFLIMR